MYKQIRGWHGPASAKAQSHRNYYHDTFNACFILSAICSTIDAQNVLLLVTLSLNTWINQKFIWSNSVVSRHLSCVYHCPIIIFLLSSSSSNRLNIICANCQMATTVWSLPNFLWILNFIQQFEYRWRHVDDVATVMMTIVMLDYVTESK